MKFIENQQVPDFSGIDMFGLPFSSSQLKCKKVYLTFFRVASCPFCNLRMHQLIQKQKLWSSENIEVIAVFSSPADEILQYAGNQATPFRILADPDEILYKQFGITHSYYGMFKSMFRIGTLVQIIINGFLNLKSFRQKPILTGDFIIDEKGFFLETYYGKDFGDHLSFEEIEKKLNF